MEYPKALYLSGNVEAEMVIADNPAHEAALRKEGYLRAFELPEEKAQPIKRTRKRADA